MPSFWDELLGTKPKVPDMPKLDLATEQQKAIAGNQAALPGAEKLAASTNLFNQDQITKMLQSAIPGYNEMTGKISSNISSELSGQIPKDVQDMIRNSSAASAVAGGVSGSELGRNITARDLGLTSLQMTATGLSQAESWMSQMDRIYSPSMMNVSSMFISPMQQYTTDNEQNMQQFQQQWMTNQVAAQPAMWAQDLKEAVEATLAAYGGGSYQHAGTMPVQGGMGGGTRSGIDGGTGNTGMYGGPSGPEGDFGTDAGFGGGDFGSAGAGGVTGDFGGGFGGAAGGLI